MEILYDVLQVAIGSLVTILFNYIRSAHGVLKVDHSNPEKDIYRFEIDNLDVLSKKKYAVLKIDHNANLSQN